MAVPQGSLEAMPIWIGRTIVILLVEDELAYAYNQCMHNVGGEVVRAW